MLSEVIPSDTGAPAFQITDAMLPVVRANARQLVEIVVPPGDVLTAEEMAEIEEEIGRPVDSWVAVPYLGAPTGASLTPAPTRAARSVPRLMRSTRTGRATTARRSAAHKSSRRSSATASGDDGGGSEPGSGCSTQPRDLRSQGRRANSLQVEVAR